MNTGIIDNIADNTDWKSYKASDLSYPADSLIDAYKKGEQDGFTNKVKAINMQVRNDLTFISEDMDKLSKKVKNLGFKVNNYYLRINKPSNYNVIITVPYETYVDKKFLPVLSEAQLISNSRSFKFDISFLASDENDKDLDRDEMIIDGFLFARDVKKDGDES